MSDRVKSLLRVIALATLFAMLGASASWAQLGGPGLSGNGVGPAPDIAGQQAPKVAPKRPLPPALPGAAKSDPSLVAPATKQASDMSPNDALFDAINRGDLSAARDAVNRGADMGSHNVLGMTPMDLAIDLSRNDILFMLLSERGADTSGRGPPQPSKGGKAILAAQKQPVVERTRVSASVKVAPPPQPRVAKLFSGDGGTPVPQSGFLGFDSSAGRN
jgi:hypothetical protein